MLKSSGLRAKSFLKKGKENNILKSRVDECRWVGNLKFFCLDKQNNSKSQMKRSNNPARIGEDEITISSIVVFQVFIDLKKESLTFSKVQ